MAKQVTAHAGQAAGRDIKNSSQGNTGQIGILGDGAIGNVIIQNLHIDLGLARTVLRAIRMTHIRIKVES